VTISLSKLLSISINDINFVCMARSIAVILLSSTPIISYNTSLPPAMNKDSSRVYLINNDLI
jgi:hypothetical protein